MIRLTRLSGHEFWLNADLIESMESTPDTVIVLVDGRRLVVCESPALVAQMYVSFRAAILVSAGVGALDESRAVHVESDALAASRGDTPRHPAISDEDPTLALRDKQQGLEAAASPQEEGLER